MACADTHMQLLAKLSLLSLTHATTHRLSPPSKHLAVSSPTLPTLRKRTLPPHSPLSMSSSPPTAPTNVTFPFQNSPNSSPSMPSHHSLCSRCSASCCGVWTSTGTTPSLLRSCWSSSSVPSYSRRVMALYQLEKLIAFVMTESAHLDGIPHDERHALQCFGVQGRQVGREHQLRARPWRSR